MLDSLSAAMDLEVLGVQGDGCFRIEEGRPPRMTWSPKRGGAESRRDELGIGFIEEACHARTKYDAYRSRLEFLRDEAAHDGHVLNPDSEVDFREFVQSTPDIRRGNLVLLDNGNLRAIWKGGRETRLGLQFLGGRMVQYVIFKRRGHGRSVSRVAGRDSLEGLERQIDAFELHSVLCE